MSIYIDMGEWDQAHADLISEDGPNASERLTRRLAAIERIRVIEAGYDHLPGGFQRERARAEAHVKKIVDGMPPLTDEQLCKLALLLQAPAS